MSRLPGFFAVILAISAGCAESPSSSAASPPQTSAGQQPSSSVKYVCGDQPIEVTTADDKATVRVGRETFSMTRVVSASGAKYEGESDPSTMFWSKGDRATLSVRGETYPECVRADAPQDSQEVLRASGFEPGWTVEIGPETMTVVTNYGEKRVSASTPPAETSGGVTTYRLENEGVTVQVRNSLCEDDATGMPHPKTVEVQLGDQTLQGCGGEPKSLLTGDEWVVEELNGDGVVDGSRISLKFGEDGRISGMASCNSYSGPYTLTGERLTIGNVMATRKACAPALMDQESKFLDLLAKVQRFTIDETGALVLHTSEGGTILARR